MNKKLGESFRKLTAGFFYLFIFLLTWQTKLVLWSAATNFQEISLYFTHLILLLTFVSFLLYKTYGAGGPGRVSDAWYFLAGLELFIFLSFFFAPDKILAFYYYVLFLIGLSLFFLLRDGTRWLDYTESYFSKLTIVYAFLAGVFFQAVLALYQFLTQTTFSNKYLGLAVHNPEQAGTAVIEAASGRWLRAYGGLDHPNILGGVLVIALIIAAYLLAKKKLLNDFKAVAESILLFIFYFFALFALFFSFSRTAWLAFILGLLTLLITFLIQRDRWALGRLIAVFLFSALLLAIAATPYWELVQTRIKADTRLEQKSLSERTEYVDQVKTVIAKNWVFGSGIGNYTVVLEKQDSSAKSAWEYQPVHNLFLLLWAEGGIFALIFFLLFLVYLIKKDRRDDFSPALFVVLIVLMIFDHWLLSLPFGLLFLFLILGLI